MDSLDLNQQEYMYPPSSSLLFTPQQYQYPSDEIYYEAPKMLRAQTLLKRVVKTIKLSKTGNFTVKQRVPKGVLLNSRYVKGKEFVN